MASNTLKFIQTNFPIDAVSKSCIREKSIRQGHISTLQTWWARRPLAVCRAMIFLSLIPDAKTLSKNKVITSKLFNMFPQAKDVGDAINIFAGELSEWSNHDNQELISFAREVIATTNKNNPKILDSFAGGGSIPLEGLRLGLDTTAVELNPVAASALNIALRTLPGTGQELLDEISNDMEKFSHVIEKVCKKHYGDNEKEQISALFWARTFLCPECGFEVPLLQNKWLSKKAKNIAIKLGINKKKKKINIDLYNPLTTEDINDANLGTVYKKSAYCPNCQHVVSTKYIQSIGMSGEIGERLYAKYVVDSEGKREYKKTDKSDMEHFLTSKPNRNAKKWISNSFDIPLDLNGVRHLWAIQYGVNTVKDLFSERQYNVLVDIIYELNKYKEKILSSSDNHDDFLRRYLPLILVVNRLAIYSNRHSWWQSNGEFPANIFVRQAIPMVWNYVEIPANSKFAGGWKSASSWITKVISHISKIEKKGTITCGDAETLPLNDSSLDLVAIDPPYFDSITYAYLSDFFYAWMKPLLDEYFPDWFSGSCAPNKNELIVDRSHSLAPSPKTEEFFERKMTGCLQEINRVLSSDGLVTLMFGHKRIEAWELLLNAIKNSGFSVSASWAVHTERKSKFKHSKVDALSSSCILVLEKYHFPDKPRILPHDKFLKILNRVIIEKQKDSDDSKLDYGDRIMKYFAPAISESLKYDIRMDDNNIYSISDLLTDIEEILP